MLASQGAAGLLREGRRGLPLWFLVLQMLFGVPWAFLVVAQFHAWMGSLEAGVRTTIVVLTFIRDRARRYWTSR